jgi:hypothetical protein
MEKDNKDLIKLSKESIKEVFNESGYSRVANIMRGLVPSVKTFSILTAENPNGIEQDKDNNRIKNQELEKRLRSMNLGFIKVKGQYASEENSFFIPNITKDEALSLGKMFSQESIIYGEKTTEGEYDTMTIQMIYTDKRFGAISGERKVFINMNNADDYYSKVKGRKFQIPFFDEDFDNANWGYKSGAINKNLIKNETISNELNEYVNEILSENRTGKSRWINRGVLKNTLKNLSPL